MICPAVSPPRSTRRDRLTALCHIPLEKEVPRHLPIARPAGSFGIMTSMVCPESCTVPTGGSPVRVSAGAPGSRHQSAGEILQTERCVKSLEAGGSKGAGRNKVNASASSDNQPKGVREGRAAHVTAKAMYNALDPERALDLPGVWAAARYEGAVRNRRDPTWRPTSGKDRAYKAGAEVARSREGVRGVRSTGEGGDKPLEGRDPASVTLAVGVSARAWP
jgi:hypothetical protein